jgi:ariadne-1
VYTASGERLLNRAALARYRGRAAEEVSALLSTSQHVAICLLSRHRWDADVIRSACADRWFGDGQAELLREIGVGVGEEREAPQPSGEEEVECMVCFEDVPPAEAASNRCGHTFCSTCWGMHLADRITEGTLKVRCMDTTCAVDVTEAFVRKLAPAEALDKYERFALAQMM